MFKKAEHLGAKYALIVGEEEMANGILKIKNLQSQEQKEISLENLQEELDSIFHEGHEEHHHHCHCHEE
jgi:histidyl-tRNA synthetase